VTSPGSPRVVHERARDVAGHQVRGELDPLGAEVERGSQGAHEQGLGNSRDALEQDVTAAEQGDDKSGHGGVLPDDGLPHLGTQGAERTSQLQ